MPHRASDFEFANVTFALTKLTKARYGHPFVSFVSAFPHPQISKTDVPPPRRPVQLSFTREFFDYRQRHGWACGVDIDAAVALATMRGKPLLCQRDSYISGLL